MFEFCSRAADHSPKFRGKGSGDFMGCSDGFHLFVGFYTAQLSQGAETFFFFFLPAVLRGNFVYTYIPRLS